jgi:tetratricopeptide (TPR) repeat protein
MGLLEDILAEITGARPEQPVEDSPVIRFSNALLLRMAPENATHLRILAAPQGEIDFRVDGRWCNGPRIEGARPETVTRLCQEVIARLAEMCVVDTRAPCSFGSMYLLLGPQDQRPIKALELSAFHTQLERGSALILHVVRGGPPPMTEAEVATRDRVGDMLRAGYLQRNDGRSAAAGATFDRALSLSESEPTSSPMYKAELLEALARVREDACERDAAEALWRRAIAMADSASTPENVTSAYMLTELGRLELDRDDVTAARVHLDRARQIFAALLAGPHAYLQLAMQSARAECMLGEHSARRSLEDLRVLAARFKDPVTDGCAAYELGQLAGDHGDLPRAAALMREALTKLTAPQPFTADIELSLARVLRAQGREPEALSLVMHANEIMAQHYGPDHPDRVRAEVELARFEKPGRPYR